jgi:hypothetical protein
MPFAAYFYFCRTIQLSIWFFQNQDAWAKRLTLVKAGNMPWQLFAEHYDFTPDPEKTMDNDWDKYFTNFDLPVHGVPKKTLAWHAIERLLKYDADYFCLVVQDELNTTYQIEKTTAIAKCKIASLRPCINEGNAAWKPNGWIDSIGWDNLVARIVPFLQQRPEAILTALPKNFMSGADSTLTISDMNKVQIKFDGAPAGSDVTVQLNSLQIDSDFSGSYYPKPDLRISLNYDHLKYKFVKWREYPKAPATFKISAKHPVTLTPELVALK